MIETFRNKKKRERATDINHLLYAWCHAVVYLLPLWIASHLILITSWGGRYYLHLLNEQRESLRSCDGLHRVTVPEQKFNPMSPRLELLTMTLSRIMKLFLRRTEGDIRVQDIMRIKVMHWWNGFLVKFMN